MNLRTKSNQTDQKLRGGYYTPQRYADFIVKWILEKEAQLILEPSCGDGVFVKSLSEQKLKDTVLHLHDIDHIELNKAKKIADDNNLNIVATPGDYISISAESELKFDAVVGNPPYIRYQFIDASFHLGAEKCFKKVGYKFSKLSNAWVTFIFATMTQLKHGGRLGMVVPAEILQVGYAESLRDYLHKECKSIQIINPKESWFPETTQGVVMLLAEKKSSSSDVCSLNILRVENDDFLSKSVYENFSHGATIQKTLSKWNLAQLDQAQIEAVINVMENDRFTRLNNIASVKCSIVTGANQYFIVNKETIQQYDLSGYALPALRKSHHCTGLIYDQATFDDNSENNELIYLLNFNNKALNQGALDYVSLGETQGLHQRYKCRIRSPWYNIPVVKPQQALLTRFGHETLKIIHNQIDAYCTDSYYLIELKGAYSADQLSGVFINPLTMLSIELEGRFYGGGILEITPSEAHRIIIPTMVNEIPDLRIISDHISENGIVSAVEFFGWHILKQTGISKTDYNTILSAWKTLKNLRMRK